MAFQITNGQLYRKLLGRVATTVNTLQLKHQQLGEIIYTLPAGTDEVVALAKFIQLICRGKYDRYCTHGPTLRMLTTPSFLADLIEKILSVSQKVNSNAVVKKVLASAATKNKYDLDDAARLPNRHY